MFRDYLDDAKLVERSVLRRQLIGMKMEVVGETTDWSTSIVRHPVKAQIC